ncbi:MAG TPA: proline--tRNA ligase [Verrucomicrobiae bacterium]|nr:proline--tRNA ligase [Verrucomicrobiae bacterium]
MYWTKTLIPTLREAPSDAEIVSHKLLLRAGLIRKLAGGVYTFLPLGLRSLRKIEQIVREEMNLAGAMEVLMPALQPREIWEQSGRAETARDVLFKVKDSSGREWFLSPTAEEVITTLAANEINSYRQLPKNFYQISQKFRDEIRPRFGLMRAKEFVMKDAYSFDTTDEGARATYQKMYDAYARIFARCGLKAFPVEADTGVIGGSHSHEFMVPAETGENDVAYCEACGYAANIEKATSGVPKTAAREVGPAVEKFATPGVLTIEALSKEPYKVPANRQIKTLVYIVDSKPIIILIRGDDQLNETKLMAKIGAVAMRPATEQEIQIGLGAKPGSLGAVNFPPRYENLAIYPEAKVAIGELLQMRKDAGWDDCKIYADERLRGANDMTTGANEDGFHLRNVSMERDIKVTAWHDLRTVTAGEPCVQCGKPLKIRRAIEVGHVFILGTKYSEKLGASFLDEAGARKPSVMGCYGIGITRTLQAVIEQCNDKDGVIWPLSVAPYPVCITPLIVAPDSEPMKLAEKIYAELTAGGVDVILDDRDERPGVKFKDSELVGFPIRIGIGEKSLAKGEVEIKPRGGALQAVKTDSAVEAVMNLLEASSAGLRGG